MRYFQFTIPGVVVLALVSCNQSSELMERNKALILKANEELIGKGNVSYADEVIDAGYTYPGYYWEGWLDKTGKLTQKTGPAIDWKKQEEWQSRLKPE